MKNRIKGISEPRETTLAQDLLALVRYALRSRSGMVIIGGSLVGGALFLGWDWLVAAGLASVALGVLPCAAGLCMNRTGGKSCSSTTDDSGNTNASKQAERSIDAKKR